MLSAFPTLTPSSSSQGLRLRPLQNHFHGQAGDEQELCQWHHLKVVEDDFRNSTTASTTTSLDTVPWTGTAWFETAKTVMLPQHFRDLATWLTRSLAHVLYDFQREQATFSAEYLLVFPSRRFLGGEVRHRRSAPASSSATTSSALDMLPEEEERSDYDDPEYSPDDMDIDVEEGREDEAKVGQELRELPVEKPEEPPLAPELRRELYRVHRNLGHPDNQSFCRALKHAGVKTEYIKWVKKFFRCPICEGRKKPQSHRPAHLSRVMSFNDVVGVDLVYYEKKIFLNMVCWGTTTTRS